MEIQNTTRRSFMKKTTALAVGISATTLFSGLVHAEVHSRPGGKSCQAEDLPFTILSCVTGMGTDGKLYYTCTGYGGMPVYCGESNGGGKNLASDDPEWVWCPADANGKVACDKPQP